MASEVRFSREAEADLAFIADFTAGRFGSEQELRYRDGLRNAIDLLTLFPRVGADRGYIA